LILGEDTRLDSSDGYFKDHVRSDMLNLILEFMFLSIFGSIFPLGFVFSLISNILILHLNKLKLLYVVKRPVPESTNSIGSLNKILRLSSTLCYILNSLILVLTIDTIEGGSSITAATENSDDSL
jgi:hypothetical protein